MARFVAVTGAVFVLASAGFGQVWNIDFTNGLANGVTQFQSGNPDIPNMFNPGGGANNSLQVLVEDGNNYGGAINKGGEPLGTTVQPSTASMSAYYNFAWSQMPETASQTYTFAGFLGSTSVHATREALGVLLIHWKDGGHYFVRTAGFFGGVGIGNAGAGPGTTIDLGTNAPGTAMQLVATYDATTSVIGTSLFDMHGAVLGQTSGNLYSDYPNIDALPATLLTADLAATPLSYLGWMDYTGNLNLQTLTWDVSRLAYFSSATGAMSLVVPEPASALLLAAGLGVLARRRRLSVH